MGKKLDCLVEGCPDRARCEAAGEPAARPGGVRCSMPLSPGSGHLRAGSGAVRDVSGGPVGYGVRSKSVAGRPAG